MEGKINRCVSELCPLLPRADPGQGALRLSGGEQARPRSGCSHPPRLLPLVLSNTAQWQRLEESLLFSFSLSHKTIKLFCWWFRGGLISMANLEAKVKRACKIGWWIVQVTESPIVTTNPGKLVPAPTGAWPWRARGNQKRSRFASSAKSALAPAHRCRQVVTLVFLCFCYAQRWGEEQLQTSLPCSLLKGSSSFKSTPPPPKKKKTTNPKEEVHKIAAKRK